MESIRHDPDGAAATTTTTTTTTTTATTAAAPAIAGAAAAAAAAPHRELNQGGGGSSAYGLHADAGDDERDDALDAIIKKADQGVTQFQARARTDTTAKAAFATSAIFQYTSVGTAATTMVGGEITHAAPAALTFQGIGSAAGAAGTAVEAFSLVDQIKSIKKILQTPGLPDDHAEQLRGRLTELEERARQAKTEAALRLGETGADLTKAAAEQAAAAGAEAGSVVADVAGTAAPGVASVMSLVNIKRNIQNLRELSAEKRTLRTKIKKLNDDGGDSTLRSALELRLLYLENRKIAMELASLAKNTGSLVGSSTSVAATAAGGAIATDGGIASGTVLGIAAASGLVLYGYAERANVEGNVNKLPLLLERRRLEKKVGEIKGATLDEIAAVAKEIATAKISRGGANRIRQLSDKHTRLVRLYNSQSDVQQLKERIADLNTHMAQLDQHAHLGTLAIRMGTDRTRIDTMRRELKEEMQLDITRDAFQEYFAEIGLGNQFAAADDDEKARIIVDYMYS